MQWVLCKPTRTYGVIGSVEGQYDSSGLFTDQKPDAPLHLNCVDGEFRTRSNKRRPLSLEKEKDLGILRTEASQA